MSRYYMLYWQDYYVVQQQDDICSASPSLNFRADRQRANTGVQASDREATYVTRTKTAGDMLFLPDFCGVRMVLALMVISELLALVLALGSLSSGDRWADLGIISLFVQWVALTSAAVLCMSRRWLKRLPNRAAAVWSYLLLLAVTVTISEAAYWVLRSDAFDVPLPAFWHRDFLLRNLAVSAIVSAVALRYFYVQHQWKRNLESESNARIQALQSRIRPHFLFNSMNVIASLTRSSPQLAEAAVENLADLFRASLADARNRVPLREELGMARKYLHIEQLRLGERLRVEWDMDAVPEDALVPVLTLQPLLENAVYHGIEPLAEGGVISVHGRVTDGVIMIRLANPVTPQGAPLRAHSNYIGVDNVRERLVAYHGADAGLAIEEAAEQNGWRYSISLRFPYLRTDT